MNITKNNNKPMSELVQNIYTWLNSPHFLLMAICFSLLIKFSMLRVLIPQGLRALAMLKPWVLLTIVLTCSIVGDLTWIVKLCRTLFFPHIPYAFLITVIRLSWGFLIIQYQALAFFLESLMERRYRLNLLRKLLILISSTFCGYFFFIALFDNNLTNYQDRTVALLMPTPLAPLEVKMFRYTILYLLNLITLPSVFFSIRKMRREKLPKILRKQLKIFMLLFIGPYLATEFLVAVHHSIISLHTHTYAIVGISTILLAYAVYYCLRKVMKLGFLTAEPHVQSVHNENFINNFKEVLEQLSHATSDIEIERIVQFFLKETFSISHQRVALYVRSINSEINHSHHTPEHCKIEQLVESMMNIHDFNSPLSTYVRANKILIRDEIEFSNFYQETDLGNTILNALNALSADLFIPIYQQQTIIAYILVEEFSRPQGFFGVTERNQIVVFASYLSNIINLLQNRNLKTIIQQEKELREEIFNKQQELQQYRECIGSFLRNHKEKEIGIIFYKNRKFIYGNQTAKEMIGININLHGGHNLTKTLRSLASQVLEYKKQQNALAYDAANNKLVLSGILNLEDNNVIITVHYPEISDLIRQKIDLLKDPTKWDYLLYLETTESGKLINQLVPGNGEMILDFKIELFKTALNRKALLLTMPEEDLLPTVEILHHISLRQNLHMLHLTPSTNTLEIAIKIFGINPLLGLKISTHPLLEKLHATGTLFIQNIHFLPLECQEYLAEFIKYGIYRLFRSDQKLSSDVRIICATDQNLNKLVQSGKFSPNLFNELKSTSLHLPSLPLLPPHELKALADGFAEQAIKTDTFKHILELNDRDREKLVQARPVSLKELKIKIQQMLVQKSKKTNIYQETNFDTTFSINTPDLTHAARLGKHALKDPKIMTMLWNKFKNQNHIASFLGVNRSSVSRRCKDYNIQ